MNNNKHLGLLLLTLLSISLSFNSFACTPAPDPDLNNDGIVTKDDLVIVTRSNGHKPGHPRYDPQADTNCDGLVNPTDIHFVNKAMGESFSVGPVVDGVIDGRTLFSFRLGKADIHNIDFRFSSEEEQQPFTLRIDQSISPAVGLTITPDLSGTEYRSNDDKTWVYEKARQRIFATQPGEYAITTSATVLETGEIFHHTSNVRVYAADEPFVNVRLHMVENKLARNTYTFLTAGVDLSGADAAQVTAVKVKILETGEIKALQPGPGPAKLNADFGGTVPLDTTQSDRCFTYIAIAETPKGIVESANQHKTCVTRFPIGFTAPPRTGFWESLLTGNQYATHLLMINVKEGTSEQTIQEMATMINGRVVGQSTFRPDYQIELINPPDIQENFIDHYAEILKDFTEIEYIHVYYRSMRLMSISNDPEFVAGNQPNLEFIRADEAWYVLGEAGTDVAVVDTGINVVHDDLLNKLFYPTSVVPLYSEVTDISNHGTHAAGIIGAITNNGQGIAGVSRNSRIMPIRVGIGERSPITNLADPVFWGDVIEGIKVALEKNKNH